MLTKSDLKEIGKLIKPLKTDIVVIKTDLSATKADVTGMKTDMAAIKTDLSATKADVTGIKADMAATKAEIKAVNAHNSRIEMKLIEMDEKFEKNLFKWKSEICDKIDPIIGRVTTAEEENVILRAREEAREEIKDDFDKRISKLEKVDFPAGT